MFRRFYDADYHLLTWPWLTHPGIPGQSDPTAETVSG